LILSYVARFLPEDLISNFPGPIICLDTHMILSELTGFLKILPSVYVQKTGDYLNQRIVHSLGGRRMDDDVAHLAYTERLMRIKQPIEFQHWSHFVDYFVRTCSPQVSESCGKFRMPVELAGGSIVATSPETCLVSTLEELMEIDKKKEIYYAPFGRHMARSDIRKVEELNGDFYCRTLYSIPDDLVKCLPPGVSYRKWKKGKTVFFRADDTSTAFSFAYYGSIIMQGIMTFFRFRADIKASRKFYRPLGNNDYHVASVLGEDELTIAEVISSFRQKYPYKEVTDREMDHLVRSSPHYERRGQKWKFKKISVREDQVQELSQEELDRIAPLGKAVAQFVLIKNLELMFPAVTIFTRTVERIMALPTVETVLIKGIIHLVRKA